LGVRCRSGFSHNVERGNKKGDQRTQVNLKCSDANKKKRSAVIAFTEAEAKLAQEEHNKLDIKPTATEGAFCLLEH
jgi:hypothetical protein